MKHLLLCIDQHTDTCQISCSTRVRTAQRRMAERKRDRDETEVATAVQELDAAVTRDTDIKLKALQTLSSLLDSKDEA